MAFERSDGKPPTHPEPNMVERTNLMNEVWRRKGDNETYTEIEEAMGISRSLAWKLFHEALKVNAPPAAEAERILMLQQLEVLMSKAQKIFDGTTDEEIKLKAMDRLMSLYKAKRTLLGLDADKKYRVKHEHTTPFDEEVDGLMGQFEDWQQKRDTDTAAKMASRRKGFRAP
jgi:hypothetical protein